MDDATIKIAQYLGAALVMAIGAVGVSMAQGKITGKACESIAQKPESEPAIRKVFFMGIVIIETSAVYCLIIALILLLVVG